jgi:hypothetical protein
MKVFYITEQSGRTLAYDKKNGLIKCFLISLQFLLEIIFVQMNILWTYLVIRLYFPLLSSEINQNSKLSFNVAAIC